MKASRTRIFIQCQCEVCGKPFQIPESSLAHHNRIGKQRGKFCSRGCAGKSTFKNLISAGKYHLKPRPESDPEFRERFVAAWADGSKTRKEQAAAFGLPLRTFTNIADRLSLTGASRGHRKLSDPAQIAEAKARMLGGESATKILISWGMNPSGFRRKWLRRETGMQGTTAPAFWTPERKAEFQKQWRDPSWSISKMGACWGRRPGAIKKLAQDWALGHKALPPPKVTLTARKPRVLRSVIAVPPAERAALAFPYLALLNEAITRGCGNIATGFDLAQLNALRAEEGEPPVRILRAPTPARGRSAIIGRPT